MSRARKIGTAAETAFVRFLQSGGFPHAERRALHGSADLGDVTGTPGIVWEIKAGEQAANPSDGQINEWLTQTQTETRNAQADLGVLVLRRKGKPDPGVWWAHLTALDLSRVMDGNYLTDRSLLFPVRVQVGDLIPLLARAGYGRD